MIKELLKIKWWDWTKEKIESSCYKRCAAIYDCGGVPAKPIRKRFDEMVIKELLKIKWWDWTKEKIEIIHKNMIYKT